MYNAKKERSKNIGDGINKRIIDKGRMINDGKNMEKKMKDSKKKKKEK